MCFLMKNTIASSKRLNPSAVKPLDAAANVQEIRKTEEYAEWHHIYASLWDCTD